MKNCLPLMARTFDELRELINKYNEVEDIDLYEFRLDAIDEMPNEKTLKKEWIRARKISEKPIVLTYRTRSEGGYGTIELGRYNDFILKSISKLDIEYIDIELFSCIEDAKAKMYMNMCRKKGIKTILSRHEMHFPKEARDVELLLMRMKYIGCDIPKLVVFAHDDETADKLWEGAKQAKLNLDKVIAIASGEKGSWTRVKGKELGIYMNFLKSVGSRSDDGNKLGQLQL